MSSISPIFLWFFVECARTADSPFFAIKHHLDLCLSGGTPSEPPHGPRAHGGGHQHQPEADAAGSGGGGPAAGGAAGLPGDGEALHDVGAHPVGGVRGAERPAAGLLPVPGAEATRQGESSQIPNR